MHSFIIFYNYKLYMIMKMSSPLYLQVKIIVFLAFSRTHIVRNWIFPLCSMTLKFICIFPTHKLFNANFYTIIMTFATNVPNIVFKGIKMCIKKIRDSNWIRIRKIYFFYSKNLKANQVTNKQNFNKIIKSYIEFLDLVSLWTYLDYMEGLQNNVFTIILPLGPSTFFVTFINAKLLCDSLIEVI
jgi:hypothetical protein